MISNLRISVAELVVWALLAAAGLTWISLRALDGAAWLMDWLRDRVTPLLEDDDELTDLPPGMELPPERTWEQMTSHQLPITPLADELERKARESGLWSTHALQVVSSGNLGPVGERRPPWWETEQRQAYAALDLEYPSGLLARVREAAQ